MEEKRNQCFNCGFFYPPELAYFNQDYARYWSPKPIFSVNWCNNCSKVTTYKQLKVLGFFKSQMVKPDKILTLEEFAVTELASRKDYETGIVYVQLLKLIWHCLLEQVFLNNRRTPMEWNLEEQIIRTQEFIKNRKSK